MEETTTIPSPVIQSPVIQQSFISKIFNYKYTILIIVVLILLVFIYYRYRKKSTTTQEPIASTSSTKPLVNNEFIVLDINNQPIKLSGTPITGLSLPQNHSSNIITKNNNVKFEQPKPTQVFEESSENDNLAQHNLTNSEIKEITDKLNIKN